MISAKPGETFESRCEGFPLRRVDRVVALPAASLA